MRAQKTLYTYHLALTADSLTPGQPRHSSSRCFPCVVDSVCCRCGRGIPEFMRKYDTQCLFLRCLFVTFRKGTSKATSTPCWCKRFPRIRISSHTRCRVLAWWSTALCRRSCHVLPLSTAWYTLPSVPETDCSVRISCDEKEGKSSNAGPTRRKAKALMLDRSCPSLSRSACAFLFIYRLSLTSHHSPAHLKHPAQARLMTTNAMLMVHAAWHLKRLKPTHCDL